MTLLRAVFHDQDDAAEVADRLAADGYLAQSVPERFAGEDDDEDHAWAIMTDAPKQVFAALVEEYDGWPEAVHGAMRDAGMLDGPPPLDLPEGPRRVKGHFRGD